MTRYRIDVSRETGEVLLLMEAKCGFKYVLGWHNAEGLKEFAQMLLGVCGNIEADKDIRRGDSDNSLFKTTNSDR